MSASEPTRKETREMILSSIRSRGANAVMPIDIFDMFVDFFVNEFPPWAATKIRKLMENMKVTHLALSDPRYADFFAPARNTEEEVQLYLLFTCAKDFPDQWKRFEEHMRRTFPSATTPPV